MIYLLKSSDNRFYVETTARNGEPLNTSQMLDHKRLAYTNIRATMKQFPGATEVKFQDESGDEAKLYTIGLTGKPVLLPKKVKKRYHKK